MFTTYDNVHDSLPAVITNTKYPVIISTCGSYDILKFPLYNFSYCNRNWVKEEYFSQVKKYANINYLDYLNSMDDYRSFILKSSAPYGYEHEDIFSENNHRSISVRSTAPRFSNYESRQSQLTETDKLISHTDVVLNCTYDKKLGILHTRLIKKLTVMQVFYKATNKLVLKKGLGLKLSFTETAIEYKFKQSIMEYLEKNNPRLVPLFQRTNHMSSCRKVLSNPIWKDLNSHYAVAYITPRHPNYRKVLYAYKHHGTKKARQLVYKTTNKALIREYELIKSTGDISDAIKSTDALLKAGYTVDKCTAILRLFRDPDDTGRSLFKTNLYDPSVINPILSIQKDYPQISFERIANLRSSLRDHTIKTELRDIAMHLTSIRYHNSYNNVNVAIPSIDLPIDLHTISTRLGRLVATLHDVSAAAHFLHTQDAEKIYNWEDDNFIYKFAKSKLELRECGDSLRICVGGYGDKASKRGCDIVFVYKKTKPQDIYCCIEISRSKSFDTDLVPNLLNQAKLYRNAYAKTDLVLNASINKWCEELSIDIPNNIYDIEKISAVKLVTRANEIEQLNNQNAALFERLYVGGLF